MEWKTKCPAKLNLFLAVGPRDARGWHPLRTVFQAIDLCDILEVQVAEVDTLLTNVDYLPTENTITKALAEFRRHRDIPSLTISLEKRIPAQSGLGGGSSDAAGLLRILQKLIDEPIAPSELMKIALAVGADVPFFLVGGRANAQGYGEEIEAVPDDRERYYVVVKPQVDCPTGPMFAALDGKSFPWKDFPSPTDLEQEVYNDFERVAPDLCLEQIERLKEYGALVAGLTGSGSAVFGEYENFSEALTAKQLLVGTPEENVWLCRSLSRADSLQIDSLSA